MSVKFLAVVLAALTVLLGVHLMFAAVLTVTVVAAFAVVGRAMETGIRCVPRPAARLA
jgi:hypothetical protein